MLRTLFKKQMLELNTMFFIDRKTKKRRNTVGIILFILLYVFVFSALAFSFFAIYMLLSPIIEMSKAWLFFSFAGIISIFGSSLLNMFIANAYLFNAKDNDLLLSLPIEPSKILFVRMLGLLFWGALYDTILFLPAIAAYWLTVGFSVTSVVYPLIIWIITIFFVLALSVGFGYIVGIISSRLKNKSILTVLIAVLLMGVYYFFYFKLQSSVASLIQNIDKAEEFVKGAMIPFYHLGLGCEGNIVSLLIFFGISLVLFVLAYFIVSKNFISIVTRNNGFTKKEYKEETNLKQSNVKSALIRKEIKHFTSSAALMLNTGLGILIAPIGGIILLTKSQDLETLTMLLEEVAPDYLGLIPSLIIVIGFFVLSMCCFTATSISLEGKNMWITQTLPLDYKEFLNAKIKTQLLLFTPSALIYGVLASIAFKLEIETAVFVCISLVAFIFLSATVGLFANLKKYNLEWTTETYVVKQSVPVAITLFGGWGVAIIYAAASYFLMKYIEPLNLTIMFFALMVLISRFTLSWILTKGTKEIEYM